VEVNSRWQFSVFIGRMVSGLHPIPARKLIDAICHTFELSRRGQLRSETRTFLNTASQKKTPGVEVCPPF
jgi:hypothetical protein